MSSKEYHQAWYQDNKLRLKEKRDAEKAGDIDAYRAKEKVCRDRHRTMRNVRNREYMRRRNASPEYKAKKRLQRGLPPPDYDCTTVCEICNKPPPLEAKIAGHRVLHLDHCHTSGVFRGWLCIKCNVGLGNFVDSIERLESAILYLRRAEQKNGQT